MIKKALRIIIGEKNILRIVKRYNSWKLRKYGYECLDKFDKVLSSHYISYWLSYGTLLGAVREHGFIRHDDDIDVGMFCKDINKELVELLTAEGFIFKRVEITSDNKFRMMTFSYRGISFDIYGFTFDDRTEKTVTGFQVYPLEGGNWASSREKNLYRACFTHQDYCGIGKCRFGNNEFSIPNNSHDLLCKLYGDDYMTPIKGKKIFKSHIIEIIPINIIQAKIVPLDRL